MEEVIRLLLQRASEACYWKEDAEDRAQKADTMEQREMWEQTAERHALVERLWNDAVAIVKGEVR